jgi:hypothetical protein
MEKAKQLAESARPVSRVVSRSMGGILEGGSVGKRLIMPPLALAFQR